MKNKSYASVMSSTQANKQGIKQETNKKKTIICTCSSSSMQRELFDEIIFCVCKIINLLLKILFNINMIFPDLKIYVYCHVSTFL